MWNNFRIKPKACWENTTARVTPANKFASEDYCLCFLRYVCYRRSASSKCFSGGPLIIFQWKDFFQTCLSPRNSSSNDDSEDLDALKRPWRENKMTGQLARALKIKKGIVEEKLTFLVDNLCPKIPDSVKPIRKIRTILTSK